MVIIAGQWEIGYNAPLMEVYQWSLPLRDFGIKDWRMTPVSEITNREREVILTEYKDYEEMLDSCSDLPRVFFEPRTNHQNPNTIWLKDFEHPKDCVYVFGSAHFNPTLRYKREQDIVVTIETLDNKGVLWSQQCVVVALYDRLIKNGSNNSR